MTVLELREIAKEIPDVTGVTAMKKDQLLLIIKKHRGIEEEKPGTKEGCRQGCADCSGIEK